MEAKLKESEQKVHTKDRLLHDKEELLNVKSGEAAVHKANSTSAISERKLLEEKIRISEEKWKQEREELESKYRKELENAGLHHQFEVYYSFILCVIWSLLIWYLMALLDAVM